MIFSPKYENISTVLIQGSRTVQPFSFTSSISWTFIANFDKKEDITDQLDGLEKSMQKGLIYYVIKILTIIILIKLV